MFIFALRKLGSFCIIRSGVSLSGFRVKPGISALLRGQASGARLVSFWPGLAGCSFSQLFVKPEFMFIFALRKLVSFSIFLSCLPRRRPGEVGSLQGEAGSTTCPAYGYFLSSSSARTAKILDACSGVITGSW